MSQAESNGREMRGSSSDMPSYLHIKFGKIANAPHKKQEGKKIIESRIGNSQESPSYFRTDHGFISKDTYNNPYILVKPGDPSLGNNTPLKNRQTTNIFQPLKDQQIKDIFNLKEVVTQPIIEYKQFNILLQSCRQIAITINIYCIFDGQICSEIIGKNEGFQYWKDILSIFCANCQFSCAIHFGIELFLFGNKSTVTNKRKDIGKIQLEINERSVFSDEYQEVSKSSPTPFHRKANYFSDFVERNDVMNVFGGLNTRERQPKFCRVKDYTLDQTQISLLKSVKENSQPSRLWRHNQSILANKDTSFPAIDPNMTAESTLSFKLRQNPLEKPLEQQHQEKEKKNILPLLNSGSFSINQDSHYQIGSPYSSIDEQEMLRLKGNQSSANNRSMRLESLEKTITSSNKGSFINKRSSFANHSKIFQKYGHPSSQSQISKLPQRIGAAQLDVEKEEEAQKERDSIAEFEKHLKFIQGNDFGGSKMGSVFFRDSKR